MSLELMQVKAKIKLYLKTEGGRNKPIVSGYRPKLFFGYTKPITNTYYSSDCGFKLPASIEKLYPGEETEVIIGVFFKEHLDNAILSKDIFFDIKEGGKSIGEGQILENLGIKKWDDLI